MKKLILVAALVVAIAACNKNDNIAPVKDQNKYRSTERVIGGLRYYDRVANLCTYLKTGNCLPDVIVHAPRVNYLEAAISGGAQKIGAYFSSDEGIALATDIGISDEQTKKLASGTYNIIIRRSDVTSNKTYYLAGLSATLSLDNPEFVMEIDVEE